MRYAIGVIPARFQSQRFPGKPLAKILNKPMIQWVYEGARASKHLDLLIIATDDERIYQAAKAFRAEVMMTSPHHDSGTARTAEVAGKVEAEVVIDIQGDEPLVRGKMIDDLVETLVEETAPMATLYARERDLSLISDENIVKIVSDTQSYALYFSRSPLPFHPQDDFIRHIGIYAYRRDFLLRFVGLPPSKLEKAEELEQLRALENGFKIRLVETKFPALSVDTPDDIIKVENLLKSREGRDG